MKHVKGSLSMNVGPVMKFTSVVMQGKRKENECHTNYLYIMDYIFISMYLQKAF